MDEKVIIYALEELKNTTEKIRAKTEEQAIDIASIKTDISNIKEDLERILNNNKKNGKNEFYLSITALASAIVALAMTFLRGK